MIKKTPVSIWTIRSSEWQTAKPVMHITRSQAPFFHWPFSHPIPTTIIYHELRVVTYHIGEINLPNAQTKLFFKAKLVAAVCYEKCSYELYWKKYYTYVLNALNFQVIVITDNLSAMLACSSNRPTRFGTCRSLVCIADLQKWKLWQRHSPGVAFRLQQCCNTAPAFYLCQKAKKWFKKFKHIWFSNMFLKW